MSNFWHPIIGYWETMSDPSAAVVAAYPAGTVEVPKRPSPDHEWQGGEWVYVEPTPVPVEEWRETAELPRGAFLNACVAAGFITAEVGFEAADGSWPTAFNTFMEGLSPSQRIETKATWADLSAASTVRRNSPILALIAADPLVNATPEQLDAMFGWVTP